MTERQRFTVAETKERLFKRDMYTCRICGDPIRQHGTPQLAHRIPQTKSNLKRYGKEVIHHDDNLWSVCGLQCNAAALIHGEEIEQLAKAIKEEI
jgi:5-methylcytosine-specific restriction endonuclease McrA